MRAMDKIVKARSGLILDQPFFGSLSVKLTIKNDPSCQTLWTDGTFLGFNEGYVEKLMLDELKGVLAHEVMHLAFEHQARRNGRDKAKWNIAGDYAINGILEKSKFRLPAGRLRDARFDNLSADEIYKRLPSSGNDDQSGNNQNYSTDPGGCGEVRDAKDKVESENNWKIATIQAAQQAKAMMGNLPEELQRLVKEILNPKVTWQEVLRKFVEVTAKNDYSWSNPNKRYFPDLYLPSLYSKEIGEIVIAVDTSGSINDEQVSQFAEEISSILEDAQCKKIFVLYCDTRIKRVEEFESENLPLKLNPIGGGGTDFRPPFEWIKEQGLQPPCLIYLTDLESYYFPKENEVDYPVLWAKIGNWGQTPPFGEVIEI
ncbi:MAG: hypothetical protein HQK79_20415 [Desulfobacterales bacterium]|nr:hypothetical protein [Desulfobacterales bacterium]